jgi:exo-beta-1,3-glucanase (GH17 family)
VGWGIFQKLDMSAYAGGNIRFRLKSTVKLVLELEGPQDHKAGVVVPSTGGQWQEVVLPVSFFTPVVDLRRIYGLFLITSTDGPATFYVDNVTWARVPPAMATLLIQTNGLSAEPANRVASLEVNRLYTFTAARYSGFSFVNWTDGKGQVIANSAAVSFVMQSNLVLAANYVDVVKPTLGITQPTQGKRFTNAVLAVSGWVKENGTIDRVLYQLNGEPWQTASGGTNWRTTVHLAAGKNTFRVYAMDLAGNVSRTNSVSITYVVTAPVTVQVTGKGSVRPNYDGQWLEIGKSYNMKAVPGAGFVFGSWTGSLASNQRTLKFVAASNLTLIANFTDIQRPFEITTAPKTNQKVTNALITVTGKAGDNVAVTGVFCRVNTGEWVQASSANGFSNWTATVILAAGPNTISTYAMDASGNRSRTNTARLQYIVSVKLAVSINGHGTVQPDYHGQWLEIGQSYSMTAVPANRHAFANWTGSLTGSNRTLKFTATSNLSLTANFRPAGRVLFGIDFSPYQDGQSPGSGYDVPEEQLRQRMSMFIPYSEWIRTYGCTHGLEKAGRVGRELHFKTAIGAWLSADLNANEIEIANLVQAAKAGEVDLAIVGSETLLRGDLTEAQLLGYLARVKQEIPSLPVATADGYAQWLSHRALIQAVDAVLVNYYPFWAGTALSNAVPTLDGWHRRLASVTEAKPILISETGWPSDGNPVGKAVPSPENASRYFLNFLSWAETNQVSYFYFAAFDEAWKAATEGTVGPHWGICDTIGKMKPGAKSVFDGKTMADNWSGRAIPGGPGTPSIELTRIPAYGSFDNLEGEVLHVEWADYAVAVYIYVNGWWSKPTFANPLTAMQVDGSWICDVTTGGIDELARAYAAYVVPIEYNPPLLAGAGALPAELDAQAVAKVVVARNP